MARKRRWVLLLPLLTLAAAGCSPQAADVAVASRTPCPITIPDPFGFAPPPPYPTTHPDFGLTWHGTPDLWTALAVDGNHGPRKSVWWSVDFPGGGVEEQPELTVTWTRLDGDREVIDNGGDATNANTVDKGWFMIGGIDPDDEGCWEVEATYKGVSLSYVYERT